MTIPFSPLDPRSIDVVTRLELLATEFDGNAADAAKDNDLEGAEAWRDATRVIDRLIAVVREDPRVTRKAEAFRLVATEDVEDGSASLAPPRVPRHDRRAF